MARNSVRVSHPDDRIPPTRAMRLLPPRLLSSRNLESVQPRPKPKHLMWDADILRDVFIAASPLALQGLIYIFNFIIDMHRVWYYL